MTRKRLIALLAIPTMLAACDGGGDPVQQAMLETSSKNQAAAVVEGEVAGREDHASHEAATPASSNQVFAASEAEMHRLMTAASGETVDQAYVAKMVAHHQGAIAMAQVALKESREPEIRRMAQTVIDTQTREIEEMRTWRPNDAS
ncbi:MAG: DUF305 domain-containing protein [Pseudomonadota bacterium]